MREQTLKIINFSHALSEEALAAVLRAENATCKRLGSQGDFADVRQIMVQTSLDLTPGADLEGQMKALLADAKQQLRAAGLGFGSVHLLVPPAWAVAAAWIGRELPSLPVIWTAREGTPPKFVFGGSVR